MGEVVVSGVEEVAERQTKRQRVEKQDGSAAAAVQWERFLPRMVLRVLLVESDDSTRQIIAALLRKCSYRVSAVSDGLKAWQILKEKHHNIDLVLTEVELPSVSGFALLSLVMEHDVCKNIPVIMMSLHDSISMVLKCMLKGAADFLIKPVRKNELKNLWQHVWRRQTNLTATQQKVEAGTENNTASNHSSDCVVSSSRDKDSREKGSDAQSSCTTPLMEAENAYMHNIQGVSLLKCKIASNMSNVDMKQEKSAKLSRESVTQESETEEKLSKFDPNVSAPFNDPYNSIALRLGEDHDCAKAAAHYESMGSESAGNGNITSEGNGHKREADEPLVGAIDFIGTFDNHPISCHLHSGDLHGGSDKFECIPQLELSLRRFCPSNIKDDETDGRHALNPSNASAVSWYNNSTTLHSFFPGTFTELEEDTDKIRDFLSGNHSQSNDEEKLTSLTDVQSGQAEVAFPRPVSGLRYDDICTGYGHFFPSVFDAQPDVRLLWTPNPSCQQEKSPSVEANTKINNLKLGRRSSDEALNNCDDQIGEEENSLEATEEIRHDSSATGQSCSSSLCNGGVVTHQVSSNMCGSISTKSDGVTAAGIEQATATENSHDGGLASQDGLRKTGSLHSSQREAALTKFRLKRKDRCYEKKVRYQSRKRLAEQRPRMKGQFVRQVQSTIAAADVCPQES